MSSKSFLIKKKPFLFALAGVFLAALCAAGDFASAAGDRKAPDFELQDQNGKKVRLSDFRGKFVHIDFSASWCGYCRLQAGYKAGVERDLAKYDFVSFTVLSGTNTEGVRGWAERYKTRYVLEAQGPELARSYGTRGVPTNIVIRPDGTIAGRWAGAFQAPEGFIQRIRSLVPEMFKEPKKADI